MTGLWSSSSLVHESRISFAHGEKVWAFASWAHSSSF